MTITRSRTDATLHVRCNRDEQRTRSRAEPPRRHDAGGVAVLMPRDPDGGGTWILASAHGLVVCLLNRSLPEAARPAPPEPPVRPASRGLVPPALAPATTLDEAIAIASDLDARPYQPFRLVIADPGGEVAELVHEGRGVGLVRRGPAAREPWLATSSGLGDHLVEGPRGRAFAERVLPHAGRDDAALASALDRFHAEAWPDAPHLAPLMDRPDAWTISRTEVRVTADEVAMTYVERRDGATAEAAIGRSSSCPVRTSREHAARTTSPVSTGSRGG